MRSVSVIGAPSSAGAYAPGQERAPAAFRAYGLVDAIASAGVDVRDRGDVEYVRWAPDPARPLAMNLDAVARTARGVRDRVASAMHEDHHVLVLGGDCTVEVGTVAGAVTSGATTGLLYIDLDTDLNAPATSDGALDWTGVAHLLGIPGVEPALRDVGATSPLLAPPAVLFFAVDNISPPERATMAALDLQMIPLVDVIADPAGAAARAAAWGAGFDQLLVHLDVDVLSFTDFPIAENSRRDRALTFDQLATVLPIVTHAPTWRALTVTEVNPDHAPDPAATFARLVALLVDCVR
jgi:arginase